MFGFLRQKEYFRTETVRLPKKISAEVFNIQTQPIKTSVESHDKKP